LAAGEIEELVRAYEAGATILDLGKQPVPCAHNFGR
jgi:hypothetical protein